MTICMTRIIVSLRRHAKNTVGLWTQLDGRVDGGAMGVANGEIRFQTKGPKQIKN
jgi:hypothetical protein